MRSSTAFGEECRVERAQIRALEVHDARVLTQRAEQLTAARIDRIDRLAPASSRTPVKPPVDAATSTQTRP